MRAVRIWIFWLSVFCLVYPATGGVDSATAAAEKEKAAAAPTATGEGKTQAEVEHVGEGKLEEIKEGEIPATFGPIITDTAIPLDKGRLAIQPTFGLSFVTNNLTSSWRRVTAGGNYQSFGMSWKFTYGLWNNLEVYTVIPYIHNWAGEVKEPGPQGERAAAFGGLSDINLTFKYRLVEETRLVPTVSAIFSPTFPTGHFRHLNPGRLGTDELGAGTYAFTSGFNLSKYAKPFMLYGNFWYTFQTDYSAEVVDGGGNPIVRGVHPRDFVTVNLAAEYPFTKKWVGLLELTSTWDAGRIIGPQANTGPTAVLSLLPGIEYMATEKFSLALGVNFDLAGKNTTANITPLLSMVYVF